MESKGEKRKKKEEEIRGVKVISTTS